MTDQVFPDLPRGGKQRRRRRTDKGAILSRERMAPLFALLHGAGTPSHPTVRKY